LYAQSFEIIILSEARRVYFQPTKTRTTQQPIRQDNTHCETDNLA